MMSLESFEILHIINEISEKNKFRVAPIREIIKYVISKRRIKPSSVRVMVMRLHQDGYIVNPLRGCWRLTDRGKEIIGRMGIDGTGKEN